MQNIVKCFRRLEDDEQRASYIFAQVPFLCRDSDFVPSLSILHEYRICS